MTDHQTQFKEDAMWIVLTEDETFRPDEVWGPFESMEEAEDFATHVDGTASYWKLRSPEPVTA